MARGFQTARRTGTTVPRVQSIKYLTGQSFLTGALVLTDATGQLIECSANPTVVLGVALEPVASHPGYDLPNASRTNALVQGATQEVSVAIADTEQEFSCRGVNGGTDPVTPVQADIGVQYGVSKVSNDWVLNQADTVNVVVVVTDIRTDDNVFLVKVLRTVQQANQ